MKHIRIITILSALFIVLSACAAPPSAFGLGPNTGSDRGFEVQEYALVEQSADGPDHPGFQQRVPDAVNGTRAGWFSAEPGQAIEAPNQALAPFGYRLAANPSPPFSGYALYQGKELVQRDIDRFWPVTVKEGSGTASRPDFLLAYETLDGERLLASLDGIQPWPIEQHTGTDIAPVYYRDRIAYTMLEGALVSVKAGPEVLYAGPIAGTPRNLTTWGDHWALELNGKVILDGQDFNQVQGYDEVFHWQLVGGQPFYIYTKDGITHLNHAGQDLPYAYDQIIHDQPGELAVYNPGSADGLIWFYALRDGLWYYVEAGMLGE